MSPLEALCRRYATRVRQNGIVYLTHDADPLLAAAFTALGWHDRHPEMAPVDPPVEVATVVAPERAAIPEQGRRRIW